MPCFMPLSLSIGSLRHYLITCHLIKNFTIKYHINSFNFIFLVTLMESKAMFYSIFTLEKFLSLGMYLSMKIFYLTLYNLLLHMSDPVTSATCVMASSLIIMKVLIFFCIVVVLVNLGVQNLT
jgi:hypothetical protein